MTRRHIYFCGYRGTGKSAVAQKLAEQTGWPLIDLDDVIESSVNQSIGEIFQQSGETGFRELESQALQLVASHPASIISLGGGAILREQNRRLIRRTGWTVWLDAKAETLVQRLENDESTSTRRPSLTGLSATAEIETLLLSRKPMYQEVSGIQISTDNQSIQKVSEQVAHWLNQEGVLQSKNG